MKRMRKSILFALALAIGLAAWAQSNRVPGDSDYDSFSRFITDRNIFDPNRVPHYEGTRTRPHIRHVSSSAPFLSLVGIMSYSKGMFAFFNGNDSDLRQVLTVSGKVGGFTVTELTLSEAKLVSDDKTQTLELKVGDVLRQENGKWFLPDPRDVAVETSPVAEPAKATTSTDVDNSTPDDSPPPPSPAVEQNEVLKRLMQLREKENQ
jgi:hypothetical protein